MKNSVLKFGLISSVISLVLFAVPNYILDFRQFSYSSMEWMGYTSIIISLSMIFFGIKQFRDKENNNLLSFGEGMKIGTLISLMTATAVGLFMVLLMEVLDPEWMTKFMEWAMDSVRNSGDTQAKIQNQLDEMESMMEYASSGYFQGFFMFITVFVIGLMMSVISSMILKK